MKNAIKRNIFIIVLIIISDVLLTKEFSMPHFATTAAISAVGLIAYAAAAQYKNLLIGYWYIFIPTAVILNALFMIFGSPDGFGILPIADALAIASGCAAICSSSGTRPSMQAFIAIPSAILIMLLDDLQLLAAILSYACVLIGLLKNKRGKTPIAMCGILLIIGIVKGCISLPSRTVGNIAETIRGGLSEVKLLGSGGTALSMDALYPLYNIFTSFGAIVGGAVFILLIAYMLRICYLAYSGIFSDDKAIRMAAAAALIIPFILESAANFGFPIADISAYMPILSGKNLILTFILSALAEKNN